MFGEIASHLDKPASVYRLRKLTADLHSLLAERGASERERTALWRTESRPCGSAEIRRLNSDLNLKMHTAISLITQHFEQIELQTLKVSNLNLIGDLIEQLSVPS